MATKISTDHPILFKGDMILAIRDGLKTQTRRVITPQPPGWWIPYWPAHEGDCIEAVHGDEIYRLKSRYGNVGDLLWVRETWQGFNKLSGSIICNGIPKVNYGGGFWVAYKADNIADKTKCPWRPSIHMPKWACRLWLKVKSVRVERVQEITWQGCKAEGVILVGDEIPFNSRKQQHSLLITKFKRLWDSINAKPRPRYTKKQISHYESYPWEDINETREHRGKPWHVIGNPFVWVVEFERNNKQ